MIGDCRSASIAPTAEQRWTAKERSESKGKYIIDVGEGYIRHGLERTLAIPVRINEHEDHWMDTRIPVTPYTEPDLEQVREEAYQNGYKDATVKISSDEQAIAEKAYQSGLNDAWEAARKIVTWPDRSLINSPIFDLDPGESIFTKYNASKCIEKIQQYEQEQQESITVEDVMRQYLDTFCKGQRNCEGCPLRTPDFTCGRGYHFLHDYVSNEEVRRAYFAVLQKMKGEES